MLIWVLLSSSIIKKAMSHHWVSKPALIIGQQPTLPTTRPNIKTPWTYYSAIGLGVLLLALAIYSKIALGKKSRALELEKFKTKELKKKLKLALVTIRKMETNPDLVYARGFNLDYLRMRMDEEVFHYVIINQTKVKISQLIGQALRPSTAKQSVGIVQGGRQVDEIFDVTYEIETQEGKWNKGVLFRIEMKLSKLPTQASSVTVNQILNCIEKYLSPDSEDNNWQPMIQGRVVQISWDQKAKPTPLLVLEQLSEGVSIFKTNPKRSVDLLQPDEDLEDDL